MDDLKSQIDDLIRETIIPAMNEDLEYKNEDQRRHLCQYLVEKLQEKLY